MKDLFSEADKERLRQAVVEAEGQTSGEIVPYIVPRSDSYEVAVWRGASGAALLALAIRDLMRRRRRDRPAAPGQSRPDP